MIFLSIHRFFDLDNKELSKQINIDELTKDIEVYEKSICILRDGELNGSIMLEKSKEDNQILDFDIEFGQGFVANIYD